MALGEKHLLLSLPQAFNVNLEFFRKTMPACKLDLNYKPLLELVIIKRGHKVVIRQEKQFMYEDKNGKILVISLVHYHAKDRLLINITAEFFPVM